MRLLVPILVLAVLSIATGTLTERSGPLVPAALSPSDVFQRSLDTMAKVRSVESTGQFTERAVEVGDPSSGGSWRIRGECVRDGPAIVSRFSYRGRQTGRHPQRVSEEYIVRVTRFEDNPSMWWRRWTVWVRSAQGHGRWHRTGVTHDAQIASSMCSSLIVPRLRLHLPGPIVDLGRVQIGGRSTLHLQSAFDGEGSGVTDDLYIDPVTFRWIRVGLSGWGAGCCHAYSGTFDFSHFNVVTHIELPRQ